MSVLLDTNVLSELLRADPDPAVLSWFARQNPESLFASSVTQAEMLLGTRLLPAGRRRSALQAAMQAMFANDFAGRILSFDSGAAQAYAEVVHARRASGRPISQFDAQIAAIAVHHGARVATRNRRDFEGCGIEVVDPWE